MSLIYRYISQLGVWLINEVWELKSVKQTISKMFRHCSETFLNVYNQMIRRFQTISV